MLDPALIQRIRTIFLHPDPRVTIPEAAGLLGWSRAEMNAAIRDGEIEVVGTCSGKRIELRELAAYALQQWPLTAVEEALGRDATLVLPRALRTRKLTVRLPRYQIGALQVLAEDGRESIDAMLMRMFEELADLNRERLARLIPGLAEAMAWPEQQTATAPAERTDDRVGGGARRPRLPLTPPDVRVRIRRFRKCF